MFESIRSSSQRNKDYTRAGGALQQGLNNQRDGLSRRAVRSCCPYHWEPLVCPLTFLSHFAFAFAQLAQAITECALGESIAAMTTERGVNCPEGGSIAMVMIERVLSRSIVEWVDERSSSRDQHI